MIELVGEIARERARAFDASGRKAEPPLLSSDWRRESGQGAAWGVIPMLEYRCYFLDADGHIRSSREFEARDDAEAVVLARALYALYAECAASHHGFELWQRSRRVLGEKPEATPEPSSALSVNRDDSSNFARVGPPPPRV